MLRLAIPGVSCGPTTGESRSTHRACKHQLVTFVVGWLPVLVQVMFQQLLTLDPVRVTINERCLWCCLLYTSPSPRDRG